MNTDTREKIDTLEEAREKIGEAVSLIQEATRGTREEERARVYTISSLETAASEDSEWLGGNPSNIDSLIRGLEVEELEKKMEETDNEDEVDRLLEEIGKLENR